MLQAHRLCLRSRQCRRKVLRQPEGNIDRSSRAGSSSRSPDPEQGGEAGLSPTLRGACRAARWTRVPSGGPGMELSGRGACPKAMTRKPVVAGSFYPGTPEKLREQIHQAFMHPLGPQEIPDLGKHRTVKGAVVPHAGYMYSGHIAAHTYAEIARDGFPDAFIILGPNHTGMGSGVALMTQGDWETPLGNMPINTEIAEHLWTGIIDKDATAHRYEHSIEVQLPFLQYLHDTTFVPLAVAMQDYETAREIGEIIGALKQDVVIIASTDFSHVGPHYMQLTPPGTSIKDWTTQQDEKALRMILNRDAKGLLDAVHTHHITMCGMGCVAAMLTAVNKRGATRTRLLKYATSYDIHPGESCVGYGALVIQ